MTAEWVRVDLDAVEKFGADAAVTLGVIAYRCNLTGEWEATLSDLTAETRLTDHRLRSALRILRDTGAVTSRRGNRFHPTLTWSVSPGHDVNGETAITCLRKPSDPESGESPITSMQEEVEETLPLDVPPTPASKPRRRTRYPDTFRPTAAHWTLAASLSVDLAAEGPKFADYHRAKGSTMANWDAALNTWIRNAGTRFRPTSITTSAALPPARSDLYG